MNIDVFKEQTPEEDFYRIAQWLEFVLEETKQLSREGGSTEYKPLNSDAYSFNKLPSKPTRKVDKPIKQNGK